MANHAQADDGEGIPAGDAAIHALIATMSRNGFLADDSERLAFVRASGPVASVRNASRDDAVIHCHDELTEAIRSGNTEAAAEAAANHVMLFRTRLGRLIQAVSPGARSAGRLRAARRSRRERRDGRDESRGGRA